MGPIAQAIKGGQDKKAAKKNQAFAERQQRAGAQLINELDYEPMYASSRVPTYQRSQSPVARSFLESFLVGNNPSATFSGAPNAAATKQRQQTAQNAMFGTPEARIAQQRQMEAATPWKVKPPTRKVNPQAGASPGAADWTMQNNDLAGVGLNKNLYDALDETGLDLNAMRDKKKWKNSSQAGEYVRTQAIMDKILSEKYGGNADRLAADIRAAGGLEALAKQKKW